MIKVFHRVIGVAFSFLMPVLTVSSSAMALTERQFNLFSQNSIFFYNPTTEISCSTAIGSFDGNGTAGLSDLQAAFVDTYHDIAERLSVAYGIPWETVVAQGILESAAGTSNFAVNRNNFFGIGAFDSNPDNAFSYDTPEEGWKGYFENIRKTATYRNHGVFVGEAITNPYVYAQAIKDAGYASDPNYVDKLRRLIAAVENRAAEKGWKSSAALSIQYPEMLANAAKYAAGGEEPALYSVTTTCVFSGNGDINATAIQLSWADRSHAPTDPKPEYFSALNAPDGVGTLGQGDKCSIGGYSCDAFLATVMRTSGKDPDFPCCGAYWQLKYLEGSDLYTEIPNIGNTSNLQPGDIRASGGHVEIVVQLEDGSFKIASASHCDRTADHYSDYYAGPNFRVFRRT